MTNITRQLLKVMEIAVGGWCVKTQLYGLKAQ